MGSVLDYIIGPTQIADTTPNRWIKLGIDKSDHAAVIVEINYELDKGKGMFRPNLAFLYNLLLLEMILKLNNPIRIWIPMLNWNLLRL